MDKTKIRKSNFELLRIFSMLLIVMWHFLCYGSVWSSSINISHHIWTLLVALIYIHVNLFVLLTGYFGCKNKFKLSKLIKTNNSIWFYVIIYTFVNIFIFNQKMLPLNIIKGLLPISFYDYWFLSCYIVLYMISPMLNVVINNVDCKKYKLILLVYFVSLLLLPYLTKDEFYNVSMGYSVINFIFLYLLGAFFRLYPIKNYKIFKNYSTKKLKIVLIICYIVTALLNFAFYELGIELGTSKSNSIKYISNILVNGFMSYNNIFIVLEAALVFNFFSLLDFKNKIINKISKYVLGIYLITENIYIRPFLYDTLSFKSYRFINAFPKLLLYVLIVFIVCILLEALRQLIFRMCSKTKLASFLRNKTINILKKYDLGDNW